MKQSSSPKKRKGIRHDTGQMVAVLVMALTVAVGGAGTTLLLATQPTGLTVEPAAQSTSEHTGTSHSRNDGNSTAHGAGSGKDAQPEEPVQAAVPEAEPLQPETAAEPEPEQSRPAEEPAAAEQPQPEPEPEQELPADALPELSETELEAENGLYRRLFQEETEALAAEDPLAPPREVPENAAADGTEWPYEKDAVTLTPEQIEAALNAGALTAEESRCLDRESVENCLRWLWDWLFGTNKEENKEEYSGWRTEKDKTYYYDPATHQAVTGVQSIDGKLYYFDRDGVMQDATFGIDVSKYQTGIDWDKIKASGVEFAIVRIGYRGYGSGALVLDPMFEEHFTNARNAGLRVGVYMFSQAINEEEAAEEAFACAYVLNGRELDYPLYFDSEASGAPNGTGRADGLNTAQRTACAVAFCEEVKANGYQPGVYASTNWFQKRLDLSALKDYSIWNAHYDVPYSVVECDLWQGTCTARIDGYNGLLDANISYID